MISRRLSGRAPVDTDMRSDFNRDKAILALQRAIKATFDDSRWHELGYLVGKHDVIADHERLLRSLHWGDDDYGSCVFAVLPDLLGHDLPWLNWHTLRRTHATLLQAAGASLRDA
jgi:hypothetical protein